MSLVIWVPFNSGLLLAADDRSTLPSGRFISSVNKAHIAKTANPVMFSAAGTTSFYRPPDHLSLDELPGWV